MKALIHRLNKVFNKYKNGKKRMFIFLGFSNVLITNLVLQLILSTGLFSVNISTLFSQIVNLFCGYFLYSRYVFLVDSSRRNNFLIKYISLMLILWNINRIGIQNFNNLKFSSNFAALIMIFPLSMISFWAQKFLVFKSIK